MIDKDKALEWFNNFTDYIAEVDINLYNDACDYADKREDADSEDDACDMLYGVDNNQ